MSLLVHLHFYLLNFIPFHQPFFHFPSSHKQLFFTPLPMASTHPNNNQTNNSQEDEEILHKFLFFNVYKSGKVTIFSPPITLLPPIDDPTTGVHIKDVHITADISARIFLPATAATTTAKLPVLLYVHGGAFCMQSAFSTEYTSFLSRLSSAANLLSVSVDYRLFPSHPLPTCYDDSFAALRWLSSTSNDDWITTHGDLNRVFIGGDSAGGNICHSVATLAADSSETGSPCVDIKGMILIHPYFGEDDKMWMYMCPDNEGPSDRRMKPAVEDLRRIKCRRVLVIVGEKDGLREAGVKYVEELVKSGWNGKVEFMENKEKDHCFHLGDPNDDEALAIQNRIVSFIHHRD